MQRDSIADLLPTERAFTQPIAGPLSVQRGRRRRPGTDSRMRCEWRRWRSGRHKRRLKITFLTGRAGLTSFLQSTYEQLLLICERLSLRAIVSIASADQSPDRTHDPSSGTWPYTVLKSPKPKSNYRYCRGPHEEIMMLHSR